MSTDLNDEQIKELLEGITQGELHNEGQVVTDDYCVCVGKQTYNWRFVACFPIDAQEGDDPPPITEAQAKANADFFVAAPALIRQLQRQRNELLTVIDNADRQAKLNYRYLHEQSESLRSQLAAAQAEIERQEQHHRDFDCECKHI